MKTAKNILIITAAIVLSSTVNAQNTKSLHYASLTMKANSFFSAKVDKMAHILTTELESLKAVVKYTPSALNEDSETESTFDFASIQESLKKDAKFQVSEDVLSTAKATDEVEINTILKELEKDSRYQPETTTLNNELTDIASGLSKDARYFPSATM